MNERSRTAVSLLQESPVARALGLAVLAWSLGVLGTSLPRASAQDAAAEPTAADEASTESAEEVNPGLAEAMERFADANALFERGDHRGALAEMQRVYDLLEGTDMQHVVLYNLGRVYEELHRYDLAVDTYQSYLARSPADAADRSDAEASLRALERLLGTIAVTVDIEHAEVWIGEWQVGEAPGEIRVPSGVHQLELRAEGYETVRRQIEITARSRIEITISMSALAAEYRGLDPALFVSSTTVAIIAAGIGAVLGGMALSMSNDGAACGTRVGCTLDVASRRREIADFALGADVLFGTAGLFAVTSIVLGFVTDWGAPPTVSVGTSGDSAFRLVPIAGPEGGGATLSVSF